LNTYAEKEGVIFIIHIFSFGILVGNDIRLYIEVQGKLAQSGKGRSRSIINYELRMINYITVMKIA
jgi:hypothetical protein